MARLHLLHGDVDYAVFWHRRAAQACGALGQDAESAFEALTEAMSDQHAAMDVGKSESDPRNLVLIRTIRDIDYRFELTDPIKAIA